MRHGGRLMRVGRAPHMVPQKRWAGGPRRRRHEKIPGFARSQNSTQRDSEQEDREARRLSGRQAGPICQFGWTGCRVRVALWEPNHRPRDFSSIVLRATSPAAKRQRVHGRPLGPGAVILNPSSRDITRTLREVAGRWCEESEEGDFSKV